MLLWFIQLFSLPPFSLTQHRHDGDKTDQQDFEKQKQLADLKKTHGHLSLPRLCHIIMQRKKRTKVKPITVVSWKVIIAGPTVTQLFSLSFSLTQHRRDGDWDKADQQEIEKQLADLKKAHGHLSLPRLCCIIMQQKKRTKVKQFRVVSLKVIIVVPKTLRLLIIKVTQILLLSSWYFYNSIFLFPCGAISHDIARRGCYCTGPGAMRYPSNHDVL